MGAYEAVSNGQAVYWPILTEEERYGIWSLHLERGGGFLDYVEFCNQMSKLTDLTVRDL